MRGRVLTRRVLVNGSSLQELVREHPVRSKGLQRGDAQEKGSPRGGRGFLVARGPCEGALLKWYDENKSLGERFDGGSDGLVQDQGLC